MHYFHTVTQYWFARQFKAPTPAQLHAWPYIKRHKPVLIAAPTGSGKTLAAFLSAIDDLLCEGLQRGLDNNTHVLYVSPLKALSNDIQKNLQIPLNGIRDALLENGYPDVDIRSLVRTGDTSQAQRQAMKKTPPHILVTTPESLYILLTSDSGRTMLSTVRSVIVDEIHALAGNKRGAHLSLSLQRLESLCPSPPTRIGLSATQKPLTEIANYLTAGNAADCVIVDSGHVRERDLAVELTSSPLDAVMANEIWSEIYDRLQQLIETHTTTLIFVNTRRLAERAAHNLAERIGEAIVTAHHGSLSKEHRLNAEQRLKSGQLKALVATASLELGIDIGDIDLVCQLGTPRSIAAFLQRVGRSGHAVGAMPKGRLFPLSRDDLVECTALIDAVDKGELDQIRIPDSPLDVLAQQLVAEIAGCEWDEQLLYKCIVKAWPYRTLSEKTFSDVLSMLAEGYTLRRGRRGAYVHHDKINRKLRGRRGAKLVAVMNAGAIPDQFDYDVIMQPQGQLVGTLNEDFAFESLPGDIFQLGNASYRMLKIENGRVFVEDAHGEPPTIPFWFGEAPGRSDELSRAVSQLRQSVSDKLDEGFDPAIAWLSQRYYLDNSAATQLVHYLAGAKAALGVIPTQQQIVLERFFDENSDMHLVVHSPFGSRVNRAWGLALRKRFCRKFNFELQAAATEDCIVLSLGATHSFPLDEVARYLHSNSVKDILVQALLAAPMFPTHWRWNANIALAVPRNRNGKKVPAYFQRNDAEDLMALVFPDQIACQENIQGDREIPDHPLVQQTVDDCLHGIMDINGLTQLLKNIECGEIKVKCCDLAGPSPLAEEVISAKPYAFLDDTPAEERRTLAIQQRRFQNPQDAAELGRLDIEAIAQVCREAWPQAVNADEMHEALMLAGFFTQEEIEQNPSFQIFIDTLLQQRRAVKLKTMSGNRFWVAAERLNQFIAVFETDELIKSMSPHAGLPPNDSEAIDRNSALIEFIRSRLECIGPVTENQLAESLGLPVADAQSALLALQQEGFVIQGKFTSPSTHFIEWCERGLLARIHRYTLKTLRKEIQPVSPAVFMRFLFQWQHVSEKLDGKDALYGIIDQLQGVSIPAAAWESEILPGRLELYIPDWLDSLCSTGRVTWLRSIKPKISSDTAAKSSPVRVTPLSLIPRHDNGMWLPCSTSDTPYPFSSFATKLLKLLQQRGACFFDELVAQSGMLRSQVESALGELVNGGEITSDSYAGIRALITPSNRRPKFGARRSLSAAANSIEDAGRWSTINKAQSPMDSSEQYARSEHIARVLLKRYGVVFRKVLERESALPSWRELLYVYRRLEARGEIRGGRFVESFAGEQFALPEAIPLLRKQRHNEDKNDLLSISAADPLNLTGIITPGERVNATLKNRVLYRDGIPIAKAGGNQVEFFGDIARINEELQWQARNVLLRAQKSLHYSQSTQSAPG